MGKQLSKLIMNIVVQCQLSFYKITIDSNFKYHNPRQLPTMKHIYFFRVAVSVSEQYVYEYAPWILHGYVSEYAAL